MMILICLFICLSVYLYVSVFSWVFVWNDRRKKKQSERKRNTVLVDFLLISSHFFPTAISNYSEIVLDKFFLLSIGFVW